METETIIQQIDAEIAKLQQAKAILSGISTVAIAKRGRPKGSVAKVAATPVAKRTMSAEGKARIAAAQKLRWAKSKKA